MKKFYLHNGTEQQGPFDYEDLKSIQISKDTQVWYEGLSDWTIAGNIEELKELFKYTTPPPFNKSMNKKPAKKSYKWWNIFRFTAGGIIILIILIAILRNYISDGYSEDGSYQEKVLTIEEIELSQPTNFLTATGTYQENFWGDKINVNCVITNEATVATYKDAIVKVTYYSKTKTVLGTNECTIYEIFPPHSTKNVSLKIENYLNVNSIGWDVISALPN